MKASPGVILVVHLSETMSDKEKFWKSPQIYGVLLDGEFFKRKKKVIMNLQRSLLTCWDDEIETLSKFKLSVKTES